MENKSSIDQIFFMQLSDKTCDSRYKEVNAKISEIEDYMQNALKDNKELLEHYNAMTAALDEYDAIAVQDFYIEGFKFGFKLAMDIFET